MTNRLSLDTLLHHLVGRGSDLARKTTLSEGDNTPTSIRLKPATKHFIVAQAEALNTSTQSVINLILDGVAQATTDGPTSQLRTMCERFFRVMSAHGLDLPTVVELMREHHFLLSALGTSERLLDLLTIDAIEHVSTIFGVDPKWLGAAQDSAVGECSDVKWYKEVPNMAHRLIAHARTGLKPDVLVIRRDGANFARALQEGDTESSTREPIGIVLRLRRSTARGEVFTTYQRGQFGCWNYWRFREQIKLLIAFCEQMEISVVGKELPTRNIDALLDGKQLPVEILGNQWTESWQPGDYASFRLKVDYEAEEWIGISESYQKSALPKIAEDAGGRPLPDEVWQPASGRETQSSTEEV